jgi:hypothetical protein
MKKIVTTQLEGQIGAFFVVFAVWSIAKTTKNTPISLAV